MKKRFLLLFLIIILTGCGKGYKLDDYESLSLAKLRLAASNSRVYSLDKINGKVGTISSEDLDYLKQIAKNYDSKSVWFSNNPTVISAINADTDSQDITYLCDNIYCAKYVIEKDGGWYLVDYSFEFKNIETYDIFILN